MKSEYITTLFGVVGLEVLAMRKISNQYWPAVEAYRKLRDESPWWLVKTKYGVLIIGDRKRVTELDWSLADVKIDGRTLTEADVTKEDTYIHAWNYVQLIEFLTAWKAAAEAKIPAYVVIPT